LTNMYAVAGL